MRQKSRLLICSKTVEPKSMIHACLGCGVAGGVAWGILLHWSNQLGFQNQCVSAGNPQELRRQSKFEEHPKLLSQKRRAFALRPSL